jgi:hypothetical protein
MGASFAEAVVDGRELRRQQERSFFKNMKNAKQSHL